MSEALIRRREELRVALCQQDPVQLASQVGAECVVRVSGEYDLRCRFLGETVLLHWPDLTVVNQNGDELPVLFGALLYYYFHTGDGTPLTGRRVSFAELPDGRTYSQAFQGYTGSELVKVFGDDIGSLKEACQELDGQPLDIGQASYLFQALPRMPIQLVYWLGDEDFPSTANLLFDENACHYLPVDGCAILGSLLTRKLIRLKE